MDLTVIIPVFNEADNLERILMRVRSGKQVEIVVVDGGSSDQTVAIAETLADQVVVSSTKGRAWQMNLGASLAKGQIFLFLHGDTLLPKNYPQLVTKTISTPGVIAGAFPLQIEGEKFSLRVLETLVNWRSRYLSLPYGDQAIFLSASTFQEMGGFPLLPIMEDFEMVMQLKHRGKIALVEEPVLTSGRRWHKLGVVKTTLVNQGMILGYFFGVPPVRLARFYQNMR